MTFSPIVSNFLLSEWLGSMTWGIYHVPINIIIMFVLFKIILRMSTILALLIIFAAHICACILFALSMLVLLKHAQYVVPTDITAIGTTIVVDAFVLGLFYSGLQICFFAFIARWKKLPLALMSAITLLSNMLTALLVIFLVTY